jgi:hypothetical protein
MSGRLDSEAAVRCCIHAIVSGGHHQLQYMDKWLPTAFECDS